MDNTLAHSVDLIGKVDHLESPLSTIKIGLIEYKYTKFFLKAIKSFKSLQTIKTAIKSSIK